MGLEEFDSRLEIVISLDPLALGDLHCIGSHPTVKQRRRNEGLLRLTKLGFCGAGAFLIFFQGLQDKVVSPEQTNRMAVALRERDIPVEVNNFPDEGHGFRDSNVLTAVLKSTERFFRQHLDL